MGLGNWTQSGTGISLDSVIKVAGASSLKTKPNNASYSSLVRTGFTQKNWRCEFWLRHEAPGTNFMGLKGAGYPDMDFRAYTPLTNTWYHLRGSVWYDVSTNTKWARMETEAGGIWTLLVGDIFGGTGDPVTSSLTLYTNGYYGTFNAWYDSLVIETG